MTDVRTLRIIQTMLFIKIKGEPTEDQRAAADRIAAQYEAEFGPVPIDADPKEFVRLLRFLTIMDAAKQIKAPVWR